MTDGWGLSEAERAKAAAALADAERSQTPIPPLSTTYPALTLRDAYEIQRVGIASRLAAGATIKGYKVGLTSVVMQEQLGVSEPDYGHLLSDMFSLDGSSIACDLCAPRAEPELAFVLGSSLQGPGVTVAEVLRATDFVVPAIEVIDSRIADWRITLADTIADNASSGRVVLGSHPVGVGAIDLPLVGIVLRRNGEILETGASGAVLGNPANSVCWLVNKLGQLGVGMEPGHVVMSGSITRAVDVTPGDHLRADFADLGSVSVSFERPKTPEGSEEGGASP